MYCKGVRGLYRGLVPHMWRDGPGFGVYMLIYEAYGVFTHIFQTEFIKTYFFLPLSTFILYSKFKNIPSRSRMLLPQLFNLNRKKSFSANKYFVNPTYFQ